MIDVVGLGELLIDFTQTRVMSDGISRYEQHAGGAPANVLVTLARHGKRTAFIGKVGEDPFGRFLRSALDESGVNTRGLVFERNIHTTLAFVHLNEIGDRSFSFYRRPGADMMLTKNDLDLALIRDAKIFHFGSVSLTDEPAREATLSGVDYAKHQGVSVSYDPNLRPSLWKSVGEAKSVIEQCLPFVDILKISEEEMEFLTGTVNLDKGSGYLVDSFGVKLVLITLGAKGCFYRSGNATNTVPGYQVNTVDTTGAGDTFFGAFLAKLLESNHGMGGIQSIPLHELELMIRYANAAGALTTIKKGAISAIPSAHEVLEFVGTV